jgi:linearmycin/streptolysin S transport system ATP-binding protein
MGEREIVLQVKDLSKRYGAELAVDCISFAIYRNEVVGFLGPNGAGKSTTIDMITTLQPPSSGQITYPGLSKTSHAHEVRQHIGIVPQELAIYSNLSVMDNLTYIGKMYGLKGENLTNQINHLLSEFGLTGKARARASTLSGGLKRRLNFALADIHNPDLIVLDEPTVGLDPNARLLVWQIVQGFRQSGKTVLLTTHYMDEAEALCDRIILINRGRIIAEGSTAELKTACSDDVVLFYQVEGLLPQQVLENLSHQSGVKQSSNEGNSLRLVVSINEAEAVKQWISGTGLVITGLRTDGITLDDVFARLTGRYLRDESQESDDRAN